LGQPSNSHTSDPPHRGDSTLQSSSVDPSALEWVLERQQQQLTAALATQQQTMMASFQQMFANILATRVMDNSDADSEATDKPSESCESLVSLDAEINERLEAYYSDINFLEGASAAIRDHLQHNFCSSNPGDESENTSDAGDVADDNSDHNQHYYEEDFNGGDTDAGYYDDYQDEQFDDEEGEYEDWDGNDEYQD
jgi:Tfp pilus assembly pilus retraction ATPase PilT